jgi:hypothetical protein
MADAARLSEEDALSGDRPPAQPRQVRVWVWAEGAFAPLAYPWPDADRRLRRFLDEQDFSLEFHAGTEHYPLATVYSHAPDAGVEALPHQYLVVMHFASHYELILVEDLPALLEVLRHLDPAINR